MPKNDQPMILKRINMLLLLAALFSFTGCATILSGTKAKISVEDGNPSKASIYLNGNFMGETPTSFAIPKKSFGKASEIEIKTPGYKPLKVKIEKRVQAGFVVLDLITGIVELAVDFGTGAIYTADPNVVKYKLEKE